MNLKKIPSGLNIPEDIFVIIEIPANSYPIKYEIDKSSGMLFVDRFIPSAMFYPYNYGYINNTLSLDGDPSDVMVITPYPLYPMSVIRCRPIGMLKMIDESGEDSKIIAVPNKKLFNGFNKIKNILDLNSDITLKISHFFEQYKSLEKNKWVKIKSWEDIEVAKKEIKNSVERFKEKNKN